MDFKKVDTNLRDYNNLKKRHMKHINALTINKVYRTPLTLDIEQIC